MCVIKLRILIENGYVYIFNIIDIILIYYIRIYMYMIGLDRDMFMFF